VSLDYVIYCACYSIFFRGPFFSNTVYIWLKCTFSRLQFCRKHYGSIFIRLSVVAFQNLKITRNSDKVWPYITSRSSKVIDLGVNRKHVCDFILFFSNTVYTHTVQWQRRRYVAGRSRPRPTRVNISMSAVLVLVMSVSLATRSVSHSGHINAWCYYCNWTTPTDVFECQDASAQCIRCNDPLAACIGKSCFRYVTNNGTLCTDSQWTRTAHCCYTASCARPR